MSDISFEVFNNSVEKDNYIGSVGFSGNAVTGDDTVSMVKDKLFANNQFITLVGPDTKKKRKY
jgi:hypothetical protein